MVALARVGRRSWLWARRRTWMLVALYVGGLLIASCYQEYDSNASIGSVDTPLVSESSVLPRSASVLEPEPSMPGVDPKAPPLPAQEWMLVLALVTAYQPDVDCATDPSGRPTHRTSTRASTDARPHGIAADPYLLPYGTEVLVPEYMETTFPDHAWQVDDTGGALKRDRQANFIVHLDLRYRTVSSALKKGEAVDGDPGRRHRLASCAAGALAPSS